MDDNETQKPIGLLVCIATKSKVDQQQEQDKRSIYNYIYIAENMFRPSTLERGDPSTVTRKVINVSTSNWCLQTDYP